MKYDYIHEVMMIYVQLGLKHNDIYCRLMLFVKNDDNFNIQIDFLLFS